MALGDLGGDDGGPGIARVEDAAVERDRAGTGRRRCCRSAGASRKCRPPAELPVRGSWGRTWLSRGRTARHPPAGPATRPCEGDWVEGCVAESSASASEAGGPLDWGSRQYLSRCDYLVADHFLGPPAWWQPRA